jgi:hypothetical protein
MGIYSIRILTQDFFLISRRFRIGEVVGMMLNKVPQPLATTRTKADNLSTRREDINIMAGPEIEEILEMKSVVKKRKLRKRQRQQQQLKEKQQSNVDGVSINFLKRKLIMGSP